MNIQITTAYPDYACIKISQVYTISVNERHISYPPVDKFGERLAWSAEAACAEVQIQSKDNYNFFPEKGGSVRDEKKLCNTVCPVRSECLDYALLNEEKYGVWGGMSERERYRMRKNNLGRVASKDYPNS